VTVSKDSALTFRALLAGSEFRALWLGNAASAAAGTAQSLALSVWVYDRTGSAFLAASALLASVLPQLVAGLLLLSLADRIPPRRLLGGWPVIRALVPLALSLANVPVGLAFGLVMAAGLGNAVEMAARLALLVEVVPQGGYALGRTTFNVTLGLMQVTGYAVGGALVVALGPEGAFLAAVAMNLIGAVSCLGLRPRPARAPAAATRPSSLQRTRTLLANPAIRGTLLGHWLPNGLVVGAEALYVPYAGDRAGGLFVSAALGMAAGDLAVGRFTGPATRSRMTGPLYVLLAVPYLAFTAHPGIWAAVALVGVSSIGFGGTLGLNERLVSLLPETMRGQGLGLAGSGTVSMQAIAAAVAGMLADLTWPGLAMAAMALASLLTTAALWRSLTRRGLTGQCGGLYAAGHVHWRIANEQARPPCKDRIEALSRCPDQYLPAGVAHRRRSWLRSLLGVRPPRHYRAKRHQRRSVRGMDAASRDGGSHLASPGGPAGDRDGIPSPRAAGQAGGHRRSPIRWPA